ncbi:MAG TPA: hypothetical protein VIY69_02580 [Candidatus Acidoferrales bacterium]
MASMNERFQKAWHKYDAKQGHKPSSTRQAVEWAVADGLLDPIEVDPYDILAERMANALRAETRTDSKGRRYRVNHAVRITKGGVQYTFWGVMGFAPHAHMEKAFAQRRNQIVDDNFHLKTDIDVYNDTLDDKRLQIQLVMDYTYDVAEREELESMKNRRSAA